MRTVAMDFGADLCATNANEALRRDFVHPFVRGMMADTIQRYAMATVVVGLVARAPAFVIVVGKMR